VNSTVNDACASPEAPAVETVTVAVPGAAARSVADPGPPQIMLITVELSEAGMDSSRSPNWATTVTISPTFAVACSVVALPTNCGPPRCTVVCAAGPQADGDASVAAADGVLLPLPVTLDEADGLVLSALEQAPSKGSRTTAHATARRETTSTAPMSG